MVRCSGTVVIKRFQPEDGPACHAMRRNAFLEVFSQELDAQAVEAGANAYEPTEFGRMIGAMDSFVATQDGVPVGFCTIRFPDSSTAEILYVYVDIDHLGQGIGTRLVLQAEQWIRERYPDVTSIVLDTAVPRYNQAFYEKLGYSEMGTTVCKYPTGEVLAVRLVKSSGEQSMG